MACPDMVMGRRALLNAICMKRAFLAVCIVLLLVCAARTQDRSAASDLFEFRDAFRAGSEEAGKREYAPVPWGASERDLVRERLGIVSAQAPGLLDRAAGDGPISVYRAELPGGSQAKGGYRRLTVGRNAFPAPGYDWLTRILAHELVHVADPYDRLSAEPEWNALIEPRITKAREALAAVKLSPAMAAALPIGPRRTQVEAQVRKASGLPSAYAAYNSEEALAEVVSFMLDKDAGYAPPPEMAAFLRKRLLSSASGAKDPAGAAYREGLRRAAEGKHGEAIAAFSEVVRLDARFLLAFMERAHSRQELGAKAAAIEDFSQAIALAPRYSRMRPYLVSSRGLLRVAAGDAASALADCAEARALRANYYNALFLCGRAKLATSDFPGAIADLTAAAEVLPAYKAQVEPWLQKARASQR